MMKSIKTIGWFAEGIALGLVLYSDARLNEVIDKGRDVCDSYNSYMEKGLLDADEAEAMSNIIDAYVIMANDLKRKNKVNKLYDLSGLEYRKVNNNGKMKIELKMV